MDRKKRIYSIVMVAGVFALDLFGARAPAWLARVGSSPERRAKVVAAAAAEAPIAIPSAAGIAR